MQVKMRFFTVLNFDFVVMCASVYLCLIACGAINYHARMSAQINTCLATQNEKAKSTFIRVNRQAMCDKWIDF